MRKAGWIERIALAVVGGLFLYAGATKAWNPAAFAEEVFNYRLLPWPVAVAVSLYLPWLEIVCGGSMLIRKWERGALVVVLGLCLTFLVGLISAAARGLNISCGCFGGESSGIMTAIVRDLLLIAVVAFLIIRGRMSQSPGAD